MSISSVRSSPASMSRTPAMESPALRSPSLPGAVDASASGTKASAKGSPLMDALKMDGFDAGGAGKAESLGKLLESALSVLSGITQLLQTVAQGVQGATGAQGASGGSPFSDSFQGAAEKSPVSLDATSASQETNPLQGMMASMSQAPSLE
ncbi:hypothetical protein [Corallococcus terminator]|nr:hypothetical protein [Corallococcus terminator]